MRKQQRKVFAKDVEKIIEQLKEIHPRYRDHASDAVKKDILPKIDDVMNLLTEVVEDLK